MNFRMDINFHAQQHLLQFALFPFDSAIYESSTSLCLHFGFIVTRSYGVTVSILDSESSDRGSNPRRT